MKKRIYTTFLLSLACASCIVANGGVRTISDVSRVFGIEMRTGEIIQSEYEQREAIGAYVVLRSESAVERTVLVRGADLSGGVPFGRWSNIQQLESGSVVALIEIMEKFTANDVVIDIGKQPSLVDRKDAFPVDLQSPGRKLFDAFAAAEECVVYFKTGFLPRRSFKKNGAYVLDCVLPEMVDSGYLIFVENDREVVRITQVEFYQYDQIPRQKQGSE